MNESVHEKINYVELPAQDIEAVKQFYAQAFGWTFQDYGPDYCSVTNAGLDAGFYRADQHSDTATGAALIVLYSQTLEASQAKVLAAGGKVVKEIFSFPGGRRFHFTDPNGNELAIWSDQE